jgi:hypothetical protein
LAKSKGRSKLSDSLLLSYFSFHFFRIDNCDVGNGTGAEDKVVAWIIKRLSVESGDTNGPTAVRFKLPELAVNISGIEPSEVHNAQ